MKRAEVWREGVPGASQWYVATARPVDRDQRHRRIVARSVGDITPDSPFPTHAEALAHALVEVGLAAAGHSTYIQEAGDGWTEPMEAWCVCSCGAHVWSWMQTGEPEGAIDGPHNSPWDSWLAHLAEVGLTPTNPEENR